MAPKRSPRNSSGSKKSPRQSKGEKDSANDADAEARRKKEELARKVRERLKAKQAAEAAKKDGGSLEGDSCREAPQRSSEPLRTVTGFEASSSGSDGGRTGEAQAGKNGPDSSELSIGLLRRKKVMSVTDKLPSLRLSRVFC